MIEYYLVTFYLYCWTLSNDAPYLIELFVGHLMLAVLKWKKTIEQMPLKKSLIHKCIYFSVVAKIGTFNKYIA